MTIRTYSPVPALRRTALCIAAAALMAGGAAAQSVVAPEAADKVSEGRPDRYSLVAVDNQILRVDRHSGTVAVCTEQNRAWRCSPVPLAEDAYQAEISDLAAEVDRLTARVKELEAAGPDTKLPPGAALDRPGRAEGQDGKAPAPAMPPLADDEDLEKVLTFTESAMRRFFGMVRDLQKDFEGEGR